MFYEPGNRIPVRYRKSLRCLRKETPMKFIASKTDLQSAVGTVIRAVPSHTTMKILECILIEAGNTWIRFTCNDMEMGIKTVIQGTAEVPGMIAVEAKMFSDIVRKLPEEIVRFESDQFLNITITSGKAKFTIAGNSGEEFTDLPNVERETGFEISQFTLKNLISQTVFAIAANENNKVMTGELFEVKGNILRVVALDGHRIAVRKVVLRDFYETRRVIVPGKSLLEISRIIPGEMDETAEIFLARNHIIFEFKGTRVVSRLIDGEYFNVDQMISFDYETKVTVLRTALISCVDRAALFVREGDKKPIIVDLEDQIMHLSIESPLGSMDEELDVEKEGKDLAIGFNPRFMIDALKAIDDEYISLYLINPKAPCFIRDEDESYLYLVLPVNFIR